MNKSEPPSKPEPSQLAAEIKTALSLPFFSADATSDSAQSSEPPPSLGETQSIGNLTFPRFAWTLAWTANPATLMLRLGGDLVQVSARGRWDILPPQNGDPKQIPEQDPGESGPTYFFRALKYFRSPASRHSLQYREWLATRKWVGESSNDLLAALREGRNLPGRSWTFATERPTPTFD